MADHTIVYDRDDPLRHIKCSCGWEVEDGWNGARQQFEKHNLEAEKKSKRGFWSFVMPIGR